MTKIPIATQPLDPASITEGKYWIPGRATLARNDKMDVCSTFYSPIINQLPLNSSIVACPG